MAFSTTKNLIYKSFENIQNIDREFQLKVSAPELINFNADGGLRKKNQFKTDLPNKPLVSIITVVFNGKSTLEGTILSVLNQVYDNIEYIIIDGGSVDGTIELLKKYDDAIDYWISEKDKGIYDAMNKGIKFASGKYIGLLNADDFFSSSNSIADIVYELESSSVEAVFSCLNIIDKNKINKVLRHYRVSKFKPFYWRIGIMPPHPTFYCKKNIYEKYGLYKDNYRMAADYEMMVRLFIKENVTWKFFDKVTVNMRAGGASNNGMKGQIKQNIEIVRACQENGFYTNILIVALKIPFKVLQYIAAIKFKI